MPARIEDTTPMDVLNQSASVLTLANGLEAPESDSHCYGLSLDGKAYVFFIWLLATVILIILSFIPKRKNRLSRFFGRPSFVNPVNLLDDGDRILGFVACYILVAKDVTALVHGHWFYNPTWDIPDWGYGYSWLKNFIIIGNVLFIGCLYYPIFACMSMRSSILSNILGLLYLILCIICHIWEMAACWIFPDGTWKSLLKMGLIVQVPVLLELLALTTTFSYDLLVNSVALYRIYKGIEPTGCPHEDPSIEYIKSLMKEPSLRPLTLMEKLKNLNPFGTYNGFKFPPRVPCTLAVAGIALYTIATLLGVAVHLYLSIFEIALVEYKEFITIIRWSCMISIVLAALVHVIFMMHIAVCYRKHILRMMKGNRSWHVQITRTPAKILVSAMRYSGHQVAYILWGFLVMSSLLSLIFIVVGNQIIQPLMVGEKSFLIDQMIKYLPFILFLYGLYYLQVFLAKHLFLQDDGANLALDNRRFYHCIAFLTFFLNAVIGAMAAFRRTLVALVLGTAIICRLDICLMMPGFEYLDTGFLNYLGLLEMDLHHNHPVMKGFIILLKEKQVEATKESKKRTSNSVQERLQALTRKRVRNRWWKLITLVNNPCLVAKHPNTREGNVNTHQMGIGSHLREVMGDFSTCCIPPSCLTPRQNSGMDLNYGHII